MDYLNFLFVEIVCEVNNLELFICKSWRKLKEVLDRSLNLIWW